MSPSCALRRLSWVLPLALFAGLATAANGARDQLDEAQRQLRSEKESERVAAIDTLAQIGSGPAWELVLEALDDPQPRVADEAQIQLGRAGLEFDTLLFGKQGLGKKRGMRALRVAEALGRRQTAIDDDLWTRALRHKDAALRKSLLWSLERMGSRASGDHGDLVERLQKLIGSDKDKNVRAHAWLALAALSPETAAASLQAGAQSKSTAMRAACCERMELAPAAMQVALLSDLIQDPVRVVRLRALEACARRGDREGARKLAQALGGESNTRLQWRIVELLRGLSQKKTGRNSRAWQEWARALAEDWQPAEIAVEPESDLGERTVAFVGLALLSERVSFLVDLSGSMWQKRADGRTRKQAVDQELRRALEGLSKEVRFNLIPFAARPDSWQESLTAASEKNISRALGFFEKSHSKGTGNYWDAMLLALEDPDLDTIMILGDGAPSGGVRWNLGLMGPLFAHANRFRGVFVDALLIETWGRLLGYWKDLTRATGGRWLVVKI